MTLALEPFVTYWRRRQEHIERERRELAGRAMLAARKIAALLADDFGAAWVILFGSLASGCFRKGSDIDLIVAGLPPQDFFPALAAANRLTEVWVDLKPWEDLPPYFRQRVLQTGVFIYERPERRGIAGDGS